MVKQTAAATVFVPFRAPVVGIAVHGVPIDHGVHRGVGKPNGVEQPQQIRLQPLVLGCVAKGGNGDLRQLQGETEFSVDVQRVPDLARIYYYAGKVFVLIGFKNNL